MPPRLQTRPEEEVKNDPNTPLAPPRALRVRRYRVRPAGPQSARPPAPLAKPYRQPHARRLLLRRRPLVRAARGRRRPPTDDRRRHRDRPDVLARRPVGRLHGRVRRQRRCLRRRGRGRRAAPADLPSRRRHRGRLDAGRQAGALRVGPQQLLELHATLHGRDSTAGCRPRLPLPMADARLLLPGRRAHRLHAALAVAARLEALPRRADLARHGSPRSRIRRSRTCRARTRTTRSRCGSATRSTSSPTAPAP